MKPHLTYIKCDESHLDQLVEISKATFISAFQEQNNPDDFNTYIQQAFKREKVHRELLHPDTGFYFVYADALLVAYFKLNSLDAQTDLKFLESMELERIYVLQDFQGKQLGEQILQKIKSMAKAQRKTFLWLGVWERNTRAIQFYQRQGFEKFGTHPYFIGSDEQTDWLMRFELSTLYI
jgi:ribosomal protein S18 acetylase RimI-like enzyme